MPSISRRIVLKEIKVGREKLFINPRLMTLLTAERDAVPRFPGKAKHANKGAATR